MLTAWNGQMIAGYAEAGQVLKEPEVHRGRARRRPTSCSTNHAHQGRPAAAHLRRRPGREAAGRSCNAYLDDYAFLVHGLLTLHDATGEKKWLDEAKALTDTMIK